MARREGRGGYRAPSGGPRAPGVGAASQRSDAAQPIDVPNVQDAEDLTQGDRQRLEAAQRVQRIGRAAPPQVRGSAPAVSSSPPTGGRGGPPPEFLFGMPSGRPGEPASEGLPMGPGAGPEALAPEPADPKEEVLHKLLEVFGDEFAERQLLQLREARPAPTVQPPPIDETAPTGEEVEEADEPGIVDFPMDEEDLTEGEEAGEEVELVEEEEAEVEEEGAEVEVPSGDEAVAEASVEGAPEEAV